MSYKTNNNQFEWMGLKESKLVLERFVCMSLTKKDEFRKTEGYKMALSTFDDFQDSMKKVLYNQDVYKLYQEANL